MSTLEAAVINHPFLKMMYPEDGEHLLKNVREMEFRSGQIIFREGEPANRFFLIQSGRVAVEKGYSQDKAPVEIIGAGDVLGWSWLFPPFAWHFQARALEPTRAIVLDGAHLLVTCENNSEFGYRLMKCISRIVIHRMMNRK